VRWEGERCILTVSDGRSGMTHHPGLSPLGAERASGGNAAQECRIAFAEITIPHLG